MDTAQTLRARIIVLLFVSLSVVICSESAQAEDEKSPLTLDLTTALYSDYMFRGFNLYDGSSVQPSATVNWDTGFGTVSGSLWMHLSAEGDRQAEKFFEMDETLTYTINVEPLVIRAGHIWYSYPDGNDPVKDTNEAFVTLVLNDEGMTPFSLTPTFSVYEDYREFDTQYYEFGISHSFHPDSFAENIKIVPFAAFGFASNAEKAYDDNGLVQITEGVSLPINAGPFTITPVCNYSHKVDDNTVNEFWLGTTLAVTY